MRKNESSKLPRGVSFDKTHRGRKKYKTRVFFNGKDRFVGRFETVHEAAQAYQQAAGLFKKSSGDADSAEFLQHVRKVVQGINADSAAAGTSAAASQARSSLDSARDSVTPVECCRSAELLEGLASLPETLMCQLSLPGSDSSSQHSDLQQGPKTAAAAAAAALSGIQLESFFTAAGLPYSCRADSHQGMTHVLEQVMAQEVSRAMGTITNSQQQQLSIRSQHEQQLQQHADPAGLMRTFSGCSDMAAAFMQQQQQQDAGSQSCTLPQVAAAGAAPTQTAAAVYGCLSAPLLSRQAQQHQDPDAELQLMLEMVLAGAGQLEAPTPAQMHEHALQQCCNEFLAATAAAAAAAGPSAQLTALSAPQLGALASAQQQHFGTLVSGPAAGCMSAQRIMYPSGGMPAQRASLEVSSSRMVAPAGLDRQSSLLMQSDTCLDAVLYVAAISRAALDMYTAMLHRMFQEDAASDLVQWLSNFRQQQQTCGPAVIAAAAGSLAAAADLEALNSCVMEVMAKIVSVLINPATPVPAPSSVSSTASNGLQDSGAGRPSVDASVSRGGNSNTGPLAKRVFVMGVLERLNGCLATLHGALQQQHNLAAKPAEMWREVQCWMQQLHAQAACAEDRTALQLAALL